jgi:hypothetical protein
LCDTSKDSLCSIHIFVLTLDCIFHTSKRVVSSPVSSQLLLSLCISLSLLSSNWQLSRHRDTIKVYIKATKREKRKFCQILVHVCFIQWKIELGCLLSVAIDKQSLLYTIILCRIRARLSTATIEQSKRERERASVALIIHPIDYRSSWRHISACLILHAIMNSPSFSLLVISLYSKDSKKKRAVLMALRLNAHYHHCHAWCCMLVEIFLAAFVLVQFDLSKISHHYCRHIWAGVRINVDDQIISAYLFL